MTQVTHIASTALAAVIPTTLVRLPVWQASGFVEYLEEHERAEVLHEQGVLDMPLLKNPPADLVLLDLPPLATYAPDVLPWLQEHHCRLLPGCRVALLAIPASNRVGTLLSEYSSCFWEHQQTLLVEASALEVSLILDMQQCACLVQLELPGAGYHETAMCQWKRLTRPSTRSRIVRA